MSEEHANLFASTVPAHESTSTIESNGDRRAGSQRSREPDNAHPTHASRHEREQLTPIGEDGNERRVRHATPDEDNTSNQGNIHDDESALEEESINLMDDVVENFRREELTKLKALSNIISILDFNPSRTERAKDAAVEHYARTLDEIEALATSAIKRGEHAQRGLQFTGEPNSGSVHSRDERNDAAVDELLSQISRDSKGRKRPNSQDFIDDDDASLSNPDIDGIQSNKKRRVHESEMPWFSREEEARRTGNKECEQSRKTLALFARDPKAIKQWIQTSRTAPLGFPSSEWDNVIRGQAVNLDAVLSSLHHVSAPKENVGRVGTTEISLGRSEPTKKVQTSGEWTSAWNATIKAIKFAFPHREQELRDYGEYIEGHFSARITSAHRKIILYDAAIRNEVGGGQNILLTDTHHFSRFYSAIVMPDGIESDNAKLASKRLIGKSGAKTELCNRFNSPNGCRNSADDCKFRHACKRCKRTSHGKESCDIKEGTTARTTA